MDEVPVRLTHYDPRWPQEFQQTRSSVLQSCGGWVNAVEHIGSTAISGLIVRPTIDMIACVEQEEGLSESALLIEGLNFRQVESPPWADDAITLQKPRHIRENEAGPTHIIFLMRSGSPAWKMALGIRDRLRNNAETAISFEEAKVERWRCSEGNRQRYEADKAILFAHLIDQIEAGQDEG